MFVYVLAATQVLRVGLAWLLNRECLVPRLRLALLRNRLLIGWIKLIHRTTIKTLIAMTVLNVRIFSNNFYKLFIVDIDKYIIWLSASNLTVPRSPRTPVTLGMCHYIKHRFTKTFKMIATCDCCDKQMLFGAALRCKECKYKCHRYVDDVRFCFSFKQYLIVILWLWYRECESRATPSCCLPPELIDEYKKKICADKPDGLFFYQYIYTLSWTVFFSII